MHLPFTTGQFIEVLTRYNAAIGLAPLAAYALGIAAVALAFKSTRYGDKLISAVLAGFWAFTGIGYHLLSFSAINPIARVFGAAFVVEAVLLAVAGFRGKLHFRFADDARSRIGIVMVAWSMLVYPAIGFALGHGYPNGPVFGLTPCPLVIFTFGMLLMADRPPRYLAHIPMQWALIGSLATLSLGMTEDASLLVAGLVGMSHVILRGRQVKREALEALPQA